MYRFSLVFCFLLFSQFLIGQDFPMTDEDISIHQATAKSKTLCEKYLNRNNYPGLMVLVQKGDEILFEEGFGYSNIEHKKEVSAKSLFRIGSISKTFTAAGLQQLVQDGTIDLSKDVRSYVDYFPKKEHVITVEKVAGHIAGVRHYNGPLEMMSNKYYPTVKEGMDIFMDDPLLFEPGEKYSYSSYGWNLISAVMEEAAEVPFLDYMQEHVFDAFKMHSAMPEIRAYLPEHIVSFYIHDIAGNNQLAPDVDNSYKWAGGGFIASARDVAQFSHQMHHNPIIDKKMLKRFQTPLTLNNGKQTNYGLGWSTNTDKKGRRWVGHSGGSVGGTSMYLYYPEHDLTIVTLVNLSSARMEQLAWKVGEQFLTELESQ